MRYAMLIYETPAEFSRRNDPDEAPAYWAMWMAYSEALNKGLAVTGGAPLEPPSTATTVTTKDGARRVEDGPHGASKEHLGGFFLFDAPSLDEALEWAARCPAAATGAVEVRPVLVRSMDQPS